MKTLFVISLVTGVWESLFFSGIIFGWGMIQYVLSSEGYFSNYCLTSENTSLINRTEDNITTINSTSTAVSCKEQSQHFILVFTIASCALSFSTLPNGFIFDKFGTWISRVSAILLFTLGCVLIGISSIESSWLMYPAMSCLSVGGILLLVTNLQVGNLFGKFRSSVITLLSGSLDSSSFVFLIVKIAYDNGVAFKSIILFIAFCTVLLWIRTFVCLPKMHIPFPLPKTGVRLGIQDCKSDKKYKSKELTKMKSEETEHLAEVKEQENMNEIEDDTTSNDNLDSSSAVGQDELSYMDCIKIPLFWTNCTHFSILQLRNYFFLSTIYDWLLTLSDGNANTVSNYLNVFGTCQFFGVVFAPLNGMLMDAIVKKYKHSVPELTPFIAVMWSAVATTLLGTIFSLFVAIPILNVQYVSFILQVVFRSFLYGGNFSFLAITFPGKHFGKVYGLTMTIGGVISLLQFPLFSLVQNQFGNNFLVINIIFVFISLAMLFHPIYIYFYCNKKAKAKTALLVNGNNSVTEIKT